MEVPPFKYLGRVTLDSDNDWPEVVANLRNAQKKWARLLRVMGWEGADAHTAENSNTPAWVYPHKESVIKIQVDQC